MEKGNCLLGRPWTDEERERLRTMLAVGATTAEAAELLERPVGGVRAMAHKLKLVTWDSVTLRDRESIREHARLGWTSSRVARKFRVPVQAVDHWTGRAAP